MDCLQKLLVVFNERHQTLIKDGYRDVFSANLFDARVVRMRHTNGNYITLTANYRVCDIVQRTNGKVVHCETVC